MYGHLVRGQQDSMGNSRVGVVYRGVVYDDYSGDCERGAASGVKC